jgi:hypothetical protein
MAAKAVSTVTRVSSAKKDQVYVIELTEFRLQEQADSRRRHADRQTSTVRCCSVFSLYGFFPGIAAATNPSDGAVRSGCSSRIIRRRPAPFIGGKRS